MFKSFFSYMLILNVLYIVSSIAVSQKRDKSILYSRSAISMLLVCFLVATSEFYITFLNNGLGLFHGMLQTTSVSHFFQLFILLISMIILQLNSFYPRKIWTEDFSSLYNILLCKLIYFNSFIVNKMAEQFRILEYPLIVLFIIVGGVFLVSCSDLISIFLAIELQSYGLYLLCSIYRDSEKATSAGLTYFLLGGLSSCFILLGSGIMYANSGNTSFDGLYVINNISTISGKSILSTDYLHYINFSLVVMSVGFLFKVTAAPFHFWSPDVYDAIPTIVTTFVAIFAKISIFILLLELVVYTGNLFNSEYFLQTNLRSNNISWTFTLLISSMFSLIIGSVLGLTQFRIKRLYAYSTISHVGFILLALSINSVESIQSFIFYLLQYSLSNLNAFMLLIAIGYSLYIYVEKNTSGYYAESNSIISDRKNSPIQLISQIKGYFYINPILALSLTITIFSFVGIPPLIGFFAKQMILSSALDSGYIFMAFIAILTSVISASYYLTIIKQMFFHESDYMLNPQLTNITLKANVISRNNVNLKNIIINEKNITLNGYLSITTSILTLIILFFILNPQEWLSIANILALILFKN